MSGKSEVKYQYLAGICVNIIAISYGGFCGWPSASFLELQSDDSPLETGPMSNQDAGWVGAMMCVGGLVGTVFFSWCADKFGRKRCLLLIALPSLMGWWIIPFATTPLQLCISRLLGGFAGGGVFTAVPIYTTEFAQDKVRGVLGTLLVLFFNFGILCAFVLGYMFTYDMVAWILSALTVIFLLCFSFLPESPQHLMNNNKVKQAEKSLRYFRNVRALSKEWPDHFRFELDKLKGEEKKEDGDDSNNVTWQDFNNIIAFKAFFIGIGIMTLMQFSGCFPMLNYTATIFQQAGSSISPNAAAIIVGCIQLLGTYVSTLLVERAGRKFLLITSVLGAGLGHVSLGAYTYLDALGYDVSAFAWVPIVGFSFTIFLGAWGIMTLPYLVIAEIMPPKIRSIGSMTCLLYMWFLGFFLLKYLPIMSEVLGMYGLVFSFASCCFIGIVFLVIFVPETKGKSIETILALL